MEFKCFKYSHVREIQPSTYKNIFSDKNLYFPKGNIHIVDYNLNDLTYIQKNAL